MSTQPIKPTHAFFGGTGMVLRNVLAASLKSGHPSVAREPPRFLTPTSYYMALTRSPVARNAQKLRTLLESELSVPPPAMANLTIIEGSARALQPIKDVLRHDVDVIYSGLVSPPAFRLNPLHPVDMADPTLIHDAAALVLQALRELRAERALSKKPVYVPISSAGLPGQTADRPSLLAPVYSWVLEVVQDDTARMEELVLRASEEREPVLKGYVFMRPPLLTDGQPRGTTSLRIGWAYHHLDTERSGPAAPGPVVGYSVARKDLAAWISEEVTGEKDEWLGRCVYLTN